MTYFDAVLLGIIQGITEFIPISSDGHLALAENFGMVNDVPFFFTVSVHVGTLCATLYFFRHVIFDLIRKVIAREPAAWSVFWALALATIPAAVAGVFLNEYIDAMSASLVITGLGFFLSAFWLFGLIRIQKTAKTMTSVSLKDALIIGLFQATALLPGASRSGATIFGAKSRQLLPEDAFTFSFLLSIPAILGALVLQIIDAQVTMLPQSVVGGVVAAGVGFVALSLLKKIVITNNVGWLAGYCLGLGILSVGLGLF